MYSIERLPTVIDIGYSGEKNFREVEIDLTKWAEMMPDGVPSIVYVRPGETEADAYIAATEYDSDTHVLTWTLSDSDVFIEGTGAIQIWMEKEVEDEIVKRGKSAMVAVRVGEALNDPSAEVPAGQASWLEQMTELKTETVNASAEAQAAKTDAQSAKTDAETAQGLAEDAQEAAEDAQDAAETAQGLAEAAQEAAESARDTILGMTATAQTLSAGSDATVSYSDGVMAFGIPKGDKGDDGDRGDPGEPGVDGQDGQDGVSSYVWIRYAANQPTQDSDMETTVDEWIGIYTGQSASPPTTYTSYTWYKYKGADGDDGAGVVAGGTTGQFLMKSSDTDYDTEWADAPGLSDKADKADTVLTTTLSRGRASGSTAGTGSLAFGEDVIASGAYSQAEGYNVTSNIPYMHSFGQYNVECNTTITGTTTWSNTSSYSKGAKVSITIPGTFTFQYYICKAGYTPSSSSDGERYKPGSGIYWQNYWRRIYANGLELVEAVGWGTSSSPKNVRALTTDGDERLKGTLYINCNNDSTGGSEVATAASVTALDGSKADIVTGATDGNFAALDSNGNLTDSGKSDSDFVHKTDNEEITGNKYFEGVVEVKNSTATPGIRFTSVNNTTRNVSMSVLGAGITGETEKYGNAQVNFFEYSPDSNGAITSYYEQYRLPAVDTGRSGNGQYDILTTKDSLKNNATTTDSGYALDARMGKTLMDAIKGLLSYTSVSSESSKSFNNVPNGSLIVFTVSTSHAIISIKTSTNGKRDVYSVGTMATLAVSNDKVTATNGSTGSTGYLMIINNPN